MKMKRIIPFILGGAMLMAAQTGAHALTITGAGSTFDYPAFTKWFQAYYKIKPDVQFNYQSIGSGGGQHLLLNQTVDFGASDGYMTKASMAGAPGKILHVPIVCGGVAIAYNLPGDPQLKLDGPTLANIFLGKISKWNDPAIAALNPGVKLPDMPIIPVHRTEGSGTTWIFTGYMSDISPEWKSQVGHSVSVNWPAGVGAGAKGSEGVAGEVRQLPGAICYVELSYAIETHMAYAEMKNADGNYELPTLKTVSAALATAHIPADFRFQFPNPPGAHVYPISGVSWVLVYQHQKDAQKGKALVQFLKWAVTKGQKITPTLDYAPLPANVQKRILAELKTITY
ncbi:MAG: phosphate ABC transporter substrate-binding protein PstS [Verrucomicrobia bacterium]|nr:phosphate ABC transporter substrate-binding protein PstS [Verrucomicrobiota bacterium]MDE3099152.1 phosphate ABC transporter substrate-binding protein PstS [Verrucomicrobiota bacterium]